LVPICTKFISTTSSNRAALASQRYSYMKVEADGLSLGLVRLRTCTEFLRSTGPARRASRLLYVLSRVICKGDNQKLQPNYSSILGDLAAGGISNLYIPERDRHGAALTFENAGISLATSAAIGVLQEFVLHSHRQKKRFRVRLSYSPTDSILCLRHSQFPGHKPPS
jgi:hypothetical protein